VHNFGTCKKNAAEQCRLPTNFAAKHVFNWNSALRSGILFASPEVDCCVCMRYKAKAARALLMENGGSVKSIEKGCLNDQQEGSRYSWSLYFWNQDLQFLVQMINWKQESENKSSPATDSRFPETLNRSGPRVRLSVCEEMCQTWIASGLFCWVSEDAELIETHACCAGLARSAIFFGTSPVRLVDDVYNATSAYMTVFFCISTLSCPPMTQPCMCTLYPQPSCINNLHLVSCFVHDWIDG